MFYILLYYFYKEYLTLLMSLTGLISICLIQKAREALNEQILENAEFCENFFLSEVSTVSNDIRALFGCYVASGQTLEL